MVDLVARRFGRWPGVSPTAVGLGHFCTKAVDAPALGRSAGVADTILADGNVYSWRLVSVAGQDVSAGPSCLSFSYLGCVQVGPSWRDAGNPGAFSGRDMGD